MAKLKGAVVIDEERCKGCNICVATCPFKVLALQKKEVNNKGYHYAYMANPDACTGCTSCGTVCPDACISVYRVKIDQQQQHGYVKKKILYIPSEKNKKIN